MAAHLGPCLPPHRCRPEEDWTVPGVGLGLPFLQTGLVLGRLPHLHHQHQLETASKTLHVKMSGKADSTSTRFLICHLQSHMCQQPKVIPVNWQEMKAGVDPTEEKGVPHPFLPSQGDPCLLSSTRARELLLLLLSRVAHPPPLVFSCPHHPGTGEEGRVMWEYVCAGWESYRCTYIFILHIFSKLLLASATAQ